MAKFDYYPLEEGLKLLNRIEKAYPKFYSDSKENLKLFNLRTYNTGDKFWKKIGDDVGYFINEDLMYSGSRTYQFLKTEKEDKSARRYKIIKINALYDLCIYL